MVTGDHGGGGGYIWFRCTTIIRYVIVIDMFNKIHNFVFYVFA